MEIKYFGKYYYLSEGEVHSATWYGNTKDVTRYYEGNCFATKIDALIYKFIKLKLEWE